MARLDQRGHPEAPPEQLALQAQRDPLEPQEHPEDPQDLLAQQDQLDRLAPLVAADRQDQQGYLAQPVRQAMPGQQDRLET